MTIIEGDIKEFLKDSEYVRNEMTGRTEVVIDGDPAELYFNEDGSPILDVIDMSDYKKFYFRKTGNAYTFTKEGELVG